MKLYTLWELDDCCGEYRDSSANFLNLLESTITELKERFHTTEYKLERFGDVVFIYLDDEDACYKITVEEIDSSSGIGNRIVGIWRCKCGKEYFPVEIGNNNFPQLCPECSSIMEYDEEE